MQAVKIMAVHLKDTAAQMTAPMLEEKRGDQCLLSEWFEWGFADSIECLIHADESNREVLPCTLLYFFWPFL